MEKAVHIASENRITPQEALQRPEIVFEGLLFFVSDLSHEIFHAEENDHDVSAKGFKDRAAFEDAYLHHIARSEANALFGELRVAKEVFDATGVILPLGQKNYRCGEPQAIFHSRALSPWEKFRALTAYMRRVHPGFATTYKDNAAEAWLAMHPADAAQG